MSISDEVTIEEICKRMSPVSTDAEMKVVRRKLARLENIDKHATDWKLAQERLDLAYGKSETPEQDAEWETSEKACNDALWLLIRTLRDNDPNKIEKEVLEFVRAYGPTGYDVIIESVLKSVSEVTPQDVTKTINALTDRGDVCVTLDWKLVVKNK